MTRNNNLWGTADLSEAAFLMARGFRLAGTDGPANSRIVYFEGANPHQEVLQYYGKGKVEAKVLLDSYRSLVRIVRKNVPKQAV